MHGRLSVGLGGCGGYCDATFYQECADVDYPSAVRALSLYEAIWISLARAAQPYTLIDTLDRAWKNTRLVDFAPTGPPTPVAPWIASRTYRARFEIPDLS